MPGEVDLAYVLRAVPYRDSDLILTLLTKNSGVVGVIARGAKKSQKRFSGALDYLCLIQVQYKKTASNLAALSSAEPVKTFGLIREDLLRYHLGACLLEITRLSTREGDDSPEPYALLDASLETLDKGGDPLSILRIFQIKTIAHLGYAPEENHCTNCGENLEKKKGAWRHVGLVCDQCHDGSSTPLSPGAIKTILAAVKLPLARLATLRIPQPLERDLRPTLDAILEKILGSPTKSQEQLYELLSD